MAKDSRSDTITLYAHWLCAVSHMALWRVGTGRGIAKKIPPGRDGALTQKGDACIKVLRYLQLQPQADSVFFCAE